MRREPISFQSDMFTRQKLLFELNRRAGRPTGGIELIQWAFLLSRDTPSGGGDSFYQFLTYGNRPHSFGLIHELAKLVSRGIIEADGAAGAFRSIAPAIALPAVLNRDLQTVIDRYIDKPADAYIRRCYPAEVKFAATAVYTAGYEGLQIDGFLDLLVRNGIRRLIDVRHNPSARRYGFHKSTLMGLCERLGIDYVHVPQLGIPSADRQNRSEATDGSLFDHYERVVLSEQAGAVEKVCALVEEVPSVLVCIEAAAERCHRSRLAAEVARQTGLPVVHLVPDQSPSSFQRGGSGVSL